MVAWAALLMLAAAGAQTKPATEPGSKAPAKGAPALPLEAKPAPAPASAMTASAMILNFHIANQAALRLAKLGETRGATAALRRLAHRVVLDATKADHALRGQAADLGIKLEPDSAVQIPASAAQAAHALQTSSAADFDHQFLTALQQQSQTALPLLHRIAMQPGATPLEQLARKQEAIVRIHGQLAQMLLRPGAPA